MKRGKSTILYSLVAVVLVVFGLSLVWAPDYGRQGPVVQSGSEIKGNPSTEDQQTVGEQVERDVMGYPNAHGKRSETSGATTEPARSVAQTTGEVVAATHGKPMVPVDHDGFVDWDLGKQVDRVTEDLMNPNLPTEVILLYRELLKDSRLGDLVRNNMAEALHNQDEKSPYLHEVLIAGIDNEDERLSWRVAAVQHLAKTYPYTAEPHKVLHKLEDLGDTGKEPLGSQAMVMLDGLEQSGQIKAANINLAIRKRLEDPSYEMASRVSALTLVGRRGMKEEIDLVRRLAAKESTVQSAAIAALGKIGDRSDIPLIARFTNANNDLLASAAKSALKNIEQRTGK